MPKQKKDEPPRTAAPLFAPQAQGIYDQDNDADYQTRTAQKAKRRRGDVLYVVAMVVLAAVFLTSAGLLVKRYFDDRRTENEFSALQSLINTEAAVAPVEGEAEEGAAAVDNSAKFAALLQQNPDFIGWISIGGTNLDFPVMHSPGNVDFYLRHDFNGDYSNYGVPYLDEDCTLTADTQSDNLVIYGHNMKTGTIFGCLTNYEQSAYYQSHPAINLDTIYADGVYEVFAAFAIDVVQDQSFVYNTYLDMDEATFNEYVAEVKRRSTVKTGITPVYGEKLLTLSTCEYSTANGRYVVVARKIG